MSTVHATAVAKLIIAGEHAVVYHRPALAVPLPDITAHVTVTPLPAGSGCRVVSPDVHRTAQLGVDDDPLLDLIADVLAAWNVTPPDAELLIHSHIPIASGMGSGAAVATAIVKALARWFQRTPSTHDINTLVFRSEQRLHGTPSGIDNTVIAYNRPISFCRQLPAPDGTPRPPRIATLVIAQPITLVVADTGDRSPTHLAVAGVRARRTSAPAHYDALFDAIAAVTQLSAMALASGDSALLGAACRQNHTLLQHIGVSSAHLDALVVAAEKAGAYGAKLSGAGVGGVMFAVVAPQRVTAVQTALQRAGAVRTFVTTVASHPAEAEAHTV